MTKLIWPLILLSSAIVIYAVWVRPYLAALPAFAGAYRRIGVVETDLWAKIAGMKTILLAFLAAFLPEIPDLLQGLVGIDFGAFVPELWAKRISQAVALLIVITRVKANVVIAAPKDGV